MLQCGPQIHGDAIKGHHALSQGQIQQQYVEWAVQQSLGIQRKVYQTYVNVRKYSQKIGNSLGFVNFKDST